MTTTLEPKGFSTAQPPRRSGWIRRLAKTLQPTTRPLAGTRWIPFWGVLAHTGRTSGRAYTTPIVARPTPGGYLIPLPFGDHTQWARNLFASGEGRVRIAGHEIAVDRPAIIDSEAAGPLLARPIRWLARTIGIRQWVHVRCL